MPHKISNIVLLLGFLILSNQLDAPNTNLGIGKLSYQNQPYLQEASVLSQALDSSEPILNLETLRGILVQALNEEAQLLADHYPALLTQLLDAHSSLMTATSALNPTQIRFQKYSLTAHLLNLWSFSASTRPSPLEPQSEPNLSYPLEEDYLEYALGEAIKAEEFRLECLKVFREALTEFQPGLSIMQLGELLGSVVRIITTRINHHIARTQLPLAPDSLITYETFLNAIFCTILKLKPDLSQKQQIMLVEGICRLFGAARASTHDTFWKLNLSQDTISYETLGWTHTQLIFLLEMLLHPELNLANILTDSRSSE